MSYRTRNIATASGLALLAVIFMLIYVSKSRSSADVGKQLVSVLFATHDIPEGTPGSTLQSGAFVTKRVPRSAAVPGWISTPTQVSGEVATQDILAGEPITMRRFGPVAAAGVRSRIRGYERVVQLSGDPNQVLDRTLKAGDRVDVLGSWTPAGCDTCRASGVIVRDALVLKTSADLGGSGDSNQVPVQLRLTDEEANAVFWMVRNGGWWLILRPVIKPRSSKLDSDTAASIFQYLKRKGLTR